MANNKAHPMIRAPQKERDRAFQDNLDAIIQGMDNDPVFYGTECEVDFKNKSHRTPTPYGTVMYYLTSSRWQWKTEVHIGGPDKFVPWLVNLMRTGKSNREPEKTTHRSGVL